MPNLTDLVASLDSIPDHDESGGHATIHARQPWSPDSEAVVLHGGRSVKPATAPGFVYLLEVNLAKEVIEVWSDWREGRTPTLAEAVGAVIWYAEHDAHEPIDEFDKIHANLLIHLSDLVRLLDGHAEAHWSQWLAERPDRIARSDGNALRELRDAFGGMGSLNDLLIDPASGQRIGEADVDATNQRLRALRAQIWTNPQKLLNALSGA